MASSSRADEEAARIIEGLDVVAERDARASGTIQKVEHPLRPDYEYTLRRMDHRHPRTTNVSLGENQSMINRNENLFDWTTELHDHRFWNIFKLIGTSPLSRIRRISSPHSCMLIGHICNRSVIQCSTKSSPKLSHLEFLILLACIKTGTQNWSLSYVPLHCLEKQKWV
jgi:hypothetical protein